MSKITSIEYLDVNGDSTTVESDAVYDRYTTTDNAHYVEIEHATTLDWQ